METRARLPGILGRASRLHRFRLDTDPRRAGGAAALVGGFYGVWVARYLARHSVYDLPAIGSELLARGHGSSASIDALAPHAVAGGYDGQFALYAALDPSQAHHYIDEPSYRLGRILYPIVARLLAAGQPGAIPWTLLLVNIVAVVLGTFALALLLTRNGVSPGLALLYGCSPALFIAVDRDITEPLAYALVIAAVLAFDSERFLTSAALFGLAGLTRETTLLFPLALLALAAVGLGTRRRRPTELMLFASLAAAPYVWWRVALYIWLGHDPPPGAATLSWPPFSGLFGQSNQVALYEQLYAVVLPGLLVLAVAVLFLPRSKLWIALPLLLNAIVLIAFLPKLSYATFQSSGRITLGVVVAYLLCVPHLPVRIRPAAIIVPALLWFAPWDSFFPIAFLA